MKPKCTFSFLSCNSLNLIANERVRYKFAHKAQARKTPTTQLSLNDGRENTPLPQLYRLALLAAFL